MAENASENRRTVAVIDGNSLMHRAFHAVPPTMNAPDGRPTNAVFGFLNMFLKMVDEFSPAGVIVAFDKGRPKVRMEMLPQYKAQRPPMDPDLRAQFPMIKELLGALAVPVVELEGWEGDDILGTLARRGEEQGCDMYLVTGDRDMYQLVTEHVHVVSTRKGLSDIAVMTPESVDDLYHGITPALVPDFYGLKGDSSDNIPGVPGIGPKKASALIAQYGSLDEVIAHADEVKGKMGENLRAHIEDALVSRKIATIMTDAPVACDPVDVVFPAFSADDVSRALGSVGITAMQGRFLALIGQAAEDSAARVIELPDRRIEAVPADPDAVRAAAEELLRATSEGEWVAAALDGGQGGDGQQPRSGGGQQDAPPSVGSLISHGFFLLKKSSHDAIMTGYRCPIRRHDSSPRLRDSPPDILRRPSSRPARQRVQRFGGDPFPSPGVCLMGRYSW